MNKIFRIWNSSAAVKKIAGVEIRVAHPKEI